MRYSCDNCGGPVGTSEPVPYCPDCGEPVCSDCWAKHQEGHDTRLCDDCDERVATEIWECTDAPVPYPPPPEHLCGRCADERRERSAA